MKTTIGLNGACGRVSQRIAHLAMADDSAEIVAALEAPDHKDLGMDYGEIIGVGSTGLKLESELPVKTQVQVVIDFSSPAGTQAILKTCLDRKIPLVIATTGHTREQKDEIAGATHQIPLLQAPNMSLSVNLLFKLTQIASEALKEHDFDVEVIERHHRFKKDSPSGTALHFAEIVRKKMGQSDIVHGREGHVGARPHNEIGVHAIRVGDNFGEHQIIFSTLGETIELVHRAHSRDSYAIGAIQAAKFLADQPAGRYSMADVLGL
ncbi:MAG: 4-hydroxy-tetrahydrodipicolinate reductase [Gemmataceae bacterium]